MKHFCVYFLLTIHTLWAQCIPQFNIKGLGKDNYVNPGQDSIKITGIENTLNLEFVNCSDSIRYTLIGFEHGINTSRYPMITYHNLYGGEYRLKYWLGKLEKTIYVNVEQPIWQKWWFIPMLFLYLFLLIGLGIYFFSLHNFRQKMKVQHLRNKISADLHDEVGSNLSSIAIYAQVLRKGLKSPELIPVLDKIMMNSKESVQLMQDTVWSLNPANDTAERLFARIESYARAILGEKNISYRQDLRVDFEKIKLDMEDRKNLYMILKEGINNIAKHADATQVTLQMVDQNKRMQLVLQDNGIGFDNTKHTEGNGLRNFRERAEASGFELEFSSKAGEGTSLILLISS